MSILYDHYFSSILLTNIFFGTCASPNRSEEQKAARQSNSQDLTQQTSNRLVLVLLALLQPARCGKKKCWISENQFITKRYRVRVEDSGSECLPRRFTWVTGLYWRIGDPSPCATFRCIKHHQTDLKLISHISPSDLQHLFAIHPAPQPRINCVTWERVSHPRSCG